ncbi:glycosyltransferase [Puniceibacterium sp. IMCC21224]|uniref:glycosyltransferase n=1 Tax=Puniceibacterium sp. IMCC21224 TaxID=1618204 RepID=UPI0018CF5F34|nr:glycosyltransferase [Puniceibacterium sp. IMCC21224]
MNIPVARTGETAQTPPFVGRYSRYPDLTGARVAEGGRRLRGDIRASRPDAPLITVITVCWNSEKTLEKALRSVVQQSYDNIEYVIVDGGSTDGTLDIIRKYDDRIDYYLSEPDGGIYVAMNKGLELASGDYILMLNSDDEYTPRCVEKLVEAQRTSGADFVSAMAAYMDDQGERIRVQPSSPLDAGVALRMPLRHETMLLSAKIYNREGGYDPSYRIIADRMKTTRLFWKGYTHFELKDPLLNFSMGGVSSTDMDKLYQERQRALQEQFPGMEPGSIVSLMSLERLTPERLCEITRGYPSAEFRAAAVAYARDQQKNRHPRWKNLNFDAFEPAMPMVAVQNAGPMQDSGPLDSRPSPRISVILPVYNGAATLAECLESLLAQTLDAFEVICINDHTPDNSQEIIDDYAARDPRIVTLINQVNVGLGASRNRGIAAARGEYVFHIDPDDVIPPDALAVLYDHAEKYGSDMTRGAFMHEQLMLGQAQSKAVRKGLEEGAPHIVNTSLASSPDLLRGTEGHWSYLYRASFAKRVFYPEDLKMGQDSIFLVSAIARARTISVIDKVIYRYRANADSAMNTYTFRKFMDEIEWRRRAWAVLDQTGQSEAGDFLLFNYWNMPFFEALKVLLTPEQYQTFWAKLRVAFHEAGQSDCAQTRNPALKKIFEDNLTSHGQVGQVAAPVTATPDNDLLRIEILSTSDSGGAGSASQRSMESLRNLGHDARSLCVFSKSNDPHSRRVPLLPEVTEGGLAEVVLRPKWRAKAVVTEADEPGLTARELFSDVGSIVDFDAIQAPLDKADIVHLHWISGMIDYDRMADVMGDKPVAWTLHDMNPFTGGCHYSQGCTGYRDECRACPLLSGSNRAHEAWKRKRDAYAGIKNLHVVCPSQWLADCARESSLFGDRPIHVIPNAIPVNDFKLVNKMVARRQLGLPLDKKLIVFGADNLENLRKGGDILQKSLAILTGRSDGQDIEGIFFGASNLDVPIKTHNMGYISDPTRLSLVYAAADVFAFPSREDNAPQTVPEALLSGTPVVSFPVGNVTELVEHLETGYIAHYEDAHSFADGLSWALRGAQSGERLLQGIRGHLKAAALNDPKTSARLHQDLYREMMGRADIV